MLTFQGPSTSQLSRLTQNILVNFSWVEMYARNRAEKTQRTILLEIKNV